MVHGVEIVDCQFGEFLKMTETVPVYAFGAGRRLMRYSSLAWHFTAVIDNDSSKYGTEIEIGDRKLSVISFEKFIKLKTTDTQIIITSTFFMDIIKQMDSIEELNGMKCYIGLFMEYNFPSDKYLLKTDKFKIPSTIHYCWFGKNEIPELYQSYIETWRQQCPDYEIKMWDETNYDVGKNIYMKQAYDCKKWGFVSDYARIDIIYREGGIYLDTDVEVMKKLDDLRRTEMFCGFQSMRQVNFGLGFGAIKNHNILREILDVYEHMYFINADGSFNMKPCTYYQTEVLKQFGFADNGAYQIIHDVAVYPQEFLSPLSPYKNLGRMTENTYAVHHYAGSWGTPQMLQRKVEIEGAIAAVKCRMR